MHLLWPSPDPDVDPVDLYAAPSRGARGSRPWVLVNMIGSTDGAATGPDGRSGELGGPADRLVFSAVRAVADLVLAGAGTVRSERYGPVRLTPELEAARRARGQAPRPRVAVVSRSLRLDPSLPLFHDPAGLRPVVVTTATADPQARARLEAVADVVTAGEDRLDWEAALVVLRQATGADVVVAEGGPTVNGQLVAAGLIDELCLTVAPSLVAGPAGRITAGPTAPVLHPLQLAHVLLSDGFLLLRYVSPSAPSAS